jgi:hypothetical protein
MTRRAVGHRYGGRHKEVRQHFARRMAAGEVFNCWRCGDPITGRWDLGHVDPGAAVWLEFSGVCGRWPEHPPCNRATVAHLKARLARAERAARG